MNKKSKQILAFGAAVIIGAQISFNLLNSDFKISIGILVYSAALMLAGKYPVIPVTIISAAGVFLSRSVSFWLRSGEIMLWRFLPETVFYLVYGFLFFLYAEKKDYELSARSGIPLFLFDLISNCMELLCRYPNYEAGWDTYMGIVLVAVLRTLTILFLMSCLRYYKFSLLKSEHAERYQRLLLLNSRLNDEVVLMNKNKNMIETTMNTAYKLFKEMEENGADSALSKKVLSVAKDVHEIKKEYVLILRGLSEALELDMREDGMYIHDILRILKSSLKSAVPQGRELNIELMIEKNLYTEKHYFIMSVFRNLFMNAIEASDKEMINIAVRQSEDGDFYVFSVEDNGPGIPEENMDEIFSPGFSTKINFETGEINRGLGLNLISDLMKNQFDGTVHVESEPGRTVFTLRMPKTNWKDDRN